MALFHHMALVSHIHADVDLLQSHGFIDESELLSFGQFYDLPIEPFESYLGWNHSDGGIDMIADLNGASPDTPPACWPHSLRNANSDEHPMARAVADVPSTRIIRDAHPADSPWVRHSYAFIVQITLLTPPNPATCLQTQQRR